MDCSHSNRARSVRQFSNGELGNFLKLKKVGTFQTGRFLHLPGKLYQNALPAGVSRFADPETLKIPKLPKSELGSSSRPTTIRERGKRHGGRKVTTSFTNHERGY